MEFLMVTGLSGAGKTQTVHALEDIGYFCVDNIPADLMADFFALCERTRRLPGAPEANDRFAVVVDLRSHSCFGHFDLLFADLLQRGYRVRILYLDAGDDVLLRRFQETRRRHPLMDETVGLLQQAIARERALLEPVRSRADYLIDTSALSPRQLRERVVALFSNRQGANMSVSVMSFGFKRGLPADADLVFDVRCLPNPYYIDSLRPLTGCEAPVAEYVFGFEQAQALLHRYIALLEYSLPLYRQEGKSSLVIAFGCTGGQHRSVAFAERVGKRLQQLDDTVRVWHRDRPIPPANSQTPNKP